MRKEIEELMETCDDLMELCFDQFMDLDAIMCLDDKSIKAIQTTIKLYNKSKELSIKMAERIDEQNDKLDKIIELLEEKK